MPITIDDGRLGAAFNFRVTPQHIVIGRDGRILYVGHLADERLDAALRAAQAPVAGQASAPRAQTATAPKGHSRESTNASHFDVGDTLPDIPVTTLEGSAFHFRESAEKRPTVLVFISPWCESYLASSRPQMAANCRAVREQVDALAGESQVRWLGIASGLWATRDDLDGYRTEHKIGIPLILDESGKLFRVFRVKSVPTLLLVDAEGRIVRRIEGPDAGSPDRLRTLLKP
jgi:hypothetical protein